MKKPSTSDLRGLVAKNRFIISIILLAAAIFCLSFSPEVITPDGSEYMLIGKQMLHGRYTGSFFHRMPLLPSIFAVMYSAGMSVVSIRFIVPPAFIIMSLISTFVLVREVAGENAARISTLLLFCFPQFWRWGIKFLADIPLLAFSALTIYFFLRALKDGRYFMHLGLVMSLGMVTKLSFYILPAVLVLYLLVRRRDVFMRREFWPAVIIPGLVLSLAFYATILMHSTGHLSEVSLVLDVANRMTPVNQILTGEYTSLLYFLKLCMFPVIIFFPVGILASWRKHRLMVLFSCLFMIPFFLLWGIRLRYFSPLYPILMLFTAEGFLYLQGRFKGRGMRSAVVIVFSALAIISFVDAMYLVSLDFDMMWGADMLSGYAMTLDGKIASDYLPSYLNITNDVVVDGTWNREMFYAGNFSHASLVGMGVRYLVLSVYGEFTRNPSKETYHPRLGPFEISFVERPYTGERVPPGYDFRSDLYEEIDSSQKFKRINELHDPGGQRVFVIYEVI